MSGKGTIIIADDVRLTLRGGMGRDPSITVAYIVVVTIVVITIYAIITVITTIYLQLVTN